MGHDHAHPHHHATPAGFSLLRASAALRLAIVAGAAAALWLAVWWALATP